MRHAAAGPPAGYAAVGITRALASAMGLPSISTSALAMLVFLMPAEVRRSFMSLLRFRLPESDHRSRSDRRARPVLAVRRVAPVLRPLRAVTRSPGWRAGPAAGAGASRR